MGRFNFNKRDSSSTDSNVERRPSAVEAIDNATRRKSVDDHVVTGAGAITTKRSIIPSCILPTIFTLSLRGLGRHTKRGASFLVAPVSGGAVFPPMLGAVVDAHNTRVAMSVPLAGFLVACSFPLYLNLFKAKELDAFNESTVGTDAAPTDKAVEAELFGEKNEVVGKVERV